MRKLEGELRERYLVLLVEGRLDNALASIRYYVIPAILILHHFNFLPEEKPSFHLLVQRQELSRELLTHKRMLLQRRGKAQSEKNQ